MIDLAPGLHIPEAEYANQGNAILGIRDSGKSYTATWLAEQLLNAGIPFVAFDPIGVWRNLKLPGTGKGYEVVVAGDDADLALTPETAPEIVRAAMRENIPLVIDLYSMSLSKADWKRIVESCVRILLFENKRHGMRHVFIEEAAEFAPQRVGPDTGRVYAEIEKLARMGGNAGLGYTLINQRAEEVNKAILELCDCLFLHRQKGRHSLTALGKWMDAADVKASKEIGRSLPALGQGECWVWPQGSNTPVRVQIPTKRTHHPDRRNLAATTVAAKSGVDVGGFVQRLTTAMKDFSVPVAATSAPHERRLSHGRHGEPSSNEETTALEADVRHAEGMIAELRGECERSQQWIVALRGERNILQGENRMLHERLRQIGALVADLAITVPPESQPDGTPTPVIPERGKGIPPSVQRQIDQHRHAAPASGLPKAVAAILAVLKAHHPRTRSRASVALQAGYSANGGGFQNSLSQARTSGFIEGSNDLSITVKGMKAIGDVTPLPAGRDLVTFWLNHPQLGRVEREILRVLTSGKREAMPRGYVAIKAGYQETGGGFQNGLSRLRTLGLISGSRTLAAAEEFFPKGARS